jgi:hypothetical protein
MAKVIIEPVQERSLLLLASKLNLETLIVLQVKRRGRKILLFDANRHKLTFGFD